MTNTNPVVSMTNPMMPVTNPVTSDQSSQHIATLALAISFYLVL